MTLKKLCRKKHFSSERNRPVFPESKQYVWYLSHPIRPPPLLLIHCLEGSEKGRGGRGIHIYRIENGLHPVISVVLQKTLPKNARIVRHDVGQSVSDINQCPKTHGVRRK